MDAEFAAKLLNGSRSLDLIRKLARLHTGLCRLLVFVCQHEDRALEDRTGRQLNEVAEDIDRLYHELIAAFPGSLWSEQARRVVKRVDAKARATTELYDQLSVHRKWTKTLKGGE